MKKRWTLYRVKPQVFGNTKLIKIARWEGELSLEGLEFMSKYLDAIPDKALYMVLIKRELIKEGPISED